MTRYEIQAQGRHGEWAAEYISADPYATQYATVEEAEAAIATLRQENPAYTGAYRVVELPE